MSQLKLDHHGKPESTGQPFRLSMGLLRSAHLRSRLTRLEPRTYGLARERLSSTPLSRYPTVLMSNFNQSMILLQYLKNDKIMIEVKIGFTEFCKHRC